MWITVIGIFFLIFRIYINEFIVSKWIFPENRYISRINTYFVSLGLVFSLKNTVFNLIIFGALIPFTGIFIINDLWFFLTISDFIRKKNITRKIDIIWLFIERLTLHLPSILLGGYMFLTDISNYISTEYGIIPFLLAYLISIIPFFLLDIRWKDKKNPVLGKTIFFTYTIIFLTLLYFNLYI